MRSNFLGIWSNFMIELFFLGEVYYFKWKRLVGIASLWTVMCWHKQTHSAANHCITVLSTWKHSQLHFFVARIRKGTPHIFVKNKGYIYALSWEFLFLNGSITSYEWDCFVFFSFLRFESCNLKGRTLHWSSNHGYESLCWWDETHWRFSAKILNPCESLSHWNL